MNHRICPRHQVIVLDRPKQEMDFALVPLEFSIPGFVRRLPPVTREELAQVERDRANGGVL